MLLRVQIFTNIRLPTSNFSLLAPLATFKNNTPKQALTLVEPRMDNVRPWTDMPMAIFFFWDPISFPLPIVVFVSLLPEVSCDPIFCFVHLCFPHDSVLCTNIYLAL